MKQNIPQLAKMSEKVVIIRKLIKWLPKDFRVYQKTLKFIKRIQ